MQPTGLRNFDTKFGHSVQPAVPSGKQADPLFKKYLNYGIIIIIIIITFSAAAQRGFCLHLQLSSSLHPSEAVVQQCVVLWDKVVSSTPNPQPGGQGYLFLSGSLL
jgi:hypothetical protein